VARVAEAYGRHGAIAEVDTCPRFGGGVVWLGGEHFMIHADDVEEARLGTAVVHRLGTRPTEYADRCPREAGGGESPDIRRLRAICNG